MKTAVPMKLFVLFSYLCCVSSELNLSDGSPCVSGGINGTCVSVHRCMTAAFAYIFRRAGYDGDAILDFAEICSYKNDTPIVCCTDCQIEDTEKFKNYVVDALGYFTKKVGPKARDKCLDYFQDLPYPCRGHANIKISKKLGKSQTCHVPLMQSWFGVGGRNAERWEFPHMALLGFGNQQETARWLCGGSIISENFILTAAHCTYTTSLGNVTFVALGLLKRSDPLEFWHIHKIKRAINHPKYKPPSKYHDIALLETETKMKFGQGLLPACLDIGKHGDKTSEADASGWGQLGHKNPLADTLQVMSLLQFNDTECSSLYPEHRHLKKGYDNTTQMCYGSHQRVVDTCQGDSGGPLQINEKKCLYTVVGLTSFGKDCGVQGSAGIYTRVSHYVPWIESIVWTD